MSESPQTHHRDITQGGFGVTRGSWPNLEEGGSHRVEDKALKLQ